MTHVATGSQSTRGEIDSGCAGSGFTMTHVAEIAVDLADLMRAAAIARAELTNLLARSPLEARAVDAALTSAAVLEVQLFQELKGHRLSLEQRWELVEEAIARLAEKDRSVPRAVHSP